MSDRNTGLFLKGHVAPARIADALARAPGIRPQDLVDDEAPRVGHGQRGAHAFTLVRLRLFEVGGILLLDRGELPEGDDLELHLGRTLSQGGAAVFLHYDEERGAGGHASFRDGRLVARRYFDGREYQPVLRDLDGEHAFHVEDEEAWLWADIGQAVEEGATTVLGAGVRTDDDIADLLASTEVEVLEVVRLPDPPAAASPVGAPDRPAAATGRRARVRGLLKKLSGR